MPPRQIPQDTILFTGTPKWWNDMRYEFAQRDAQENNRPYTPYGTMSDAEKARVNAEISKATGVNPPTSTIPVSITGSSKPVNFTPQELYQAATDKDFARKVFAASTGNPNVTRADLGDFQQRLRDYHGDAIEEISQQHLAQREARGREQEVGRTAMERAEAQPHYPVAPNVAPRLRGPYIPAPAAQAGPLTPAQAQVQAGINRRQRVDLNALAAGLLPPPAVAAAPVLRGAYQAAPAPVLRGPYVAPAEAAQAGPPLPAQAQAIPLAERIQQNVARRRAEAEVDQSLLHRAAGERNVADIKHETTARTAPMNATQAQAKRMLERNLEQHDETFQTAREEIDSAKERDLSLPRVIDPYLAKSVEDPEAYMDRFREKYKRDIEGPLQSEAKLKFLEEYIPHTNAQHAVAGTFHSGARQSSLEKGREKLLRHLNNDMALRLGDAEEKAFARHHGITGRHLEAGQIAANTAKLQQEAHRANAEQLGRHAVIQKGLGLEDIKALGSVGVAEQAQRQNEINERKMEHEAEKQHALNQLERQSAHMHALPAPPQQHFTPNQLGAPNPPNPWNLANNILGTYAGFQQPQPQAHAKGGHVRAKFADGGSVANVGARFNALGQHAMPGPYEAQAAQAAQELGSYRMDPIANHMAHIGAASANFRGDPGENYARGSMAALESRDKAHDRMLEARYKAGMLYDKINGSRMDTHKLIANYDAKVAQNQEQQRHHGAMEAHNAAKLAAKGNGPSEMQMLNLEHKRAQIDALKGKSLPGEIAIGDKIISPKSKVGLTPQDLSQLKAIEKNRELNASKGMGYSQMKEFLNKQESAGEMPDTGIIAKNTPNISDLSKDYERHLEKMVAGELPSGVLTNAKLKFAKGLKPTELDSPKKVKEFAETGEKHYADLIERDQMAEDFAAHNIPPRVSFAAYDKWKKNGKKGDVVDYVKAILEGGSVPESSEGSDELSLMKQALAQMGG